MENYQPQIFKNPGPDRPRRVPREIHLELELMTSTLGEKAIQLQSSTAGYKGDAARLAEDVGVAVKKHCDPITWTTDDPDVLA